MDKQIEKKKGLQKKHIIYGVLGIILIVLVIKIATSAGTSVYRADKDKVTISDVSKGDFKDYISIIGTVEPKQTIFLDVEEGGKVEEKVVDEGTLVHKGDVIVKLSNSDLNLQILNSESSLAYQTNELRNTLISMERQRISNKQELLNKDYELLKYKRTYEQNKSLYAKGFVSKEDYLNSKENYDLSKKDRELLYEQLVQDSIFRVNQKAQMDASLKNMQQNLAMVRQRLENLNIKAPADGQISSLNVEIGQSINKGESIGQLQILGNFKVTAKIDEHYIDKVRDGLVATLERQNNNFKLITKKIYPEVRDGQFEVDLVFDGKEPDNLRTGQTYNLKLELGEPTTAVMIPRGGFFQSTGGQWIYVLDASGTKAVKRNIRIGRQNPQYYEVLEGLEPGEKVITSSYDLFGDNNVIEFK